MSRRPNVVLINCDDLGYGDLGCYGSAVNDSPAIDRLAAEGARCTDFYMASPVCSPSRAALLTGCYPLRVGFGGASTYGLGGVLFPGWDVGLHPDEVTIARLLQDAGYTTLAVGKWHCGDQPDFLPTNHGFDEWYGIPYSNDMGRQRDPDDGPSLDELGELVRSIGVTQPWIRPPLPLMEGTEVIEAQPDQASLTERYVQRAVSFMRSHRDEPFFLYLAHLYVHLPIYVQQRFLDASRNGAYGGAVASIDWAAGVIRDELERLGLAEDTLVIFTSDNGALGERSGGSGSNAPLRASKGTTWEGGQRVPAVLWWPGRIAPGVVTEPISALDLYPTIAQVCGCEVPGDRVIDGDDVGALFEITDSRPAAERPFFFIRDGDVEAVRVGRWKLHVRKGATVMARLHDLDVDVAEADDVADAHPAVVEALSALIAGARADLGDQSMGIEGAGVRAIGKVDDARPLTEFDPDHPYFMAEYDLPHRG